MPKSSKRGGAKAHRKRVKNRNNQIKGVQRKFQEEYQKAMMAQIQELRDKMSGETENTPEVLSEEQPLNIKL
jgi:hypothetical protein